jgi:hypothetical protein
MSKTKAECVMQFMQMPIKENIQFKTHDSKSVQPNTAKPGSITAKEVNALSDNSNPIISQVK